MHGNDESVLFCLGNALVLAATDHEKRGDLEARDALNAEVESLARQYPPSACE